MTQRVEARPLPDAAVIDLRRERARKEDRGFVIFSAPLKEELRQTFAAGEQAIILINRRGYAPYLLCRECGDDFRCRECSVTMTVQVRAIDTGGNSTLSQPIVVEIRDTLLGDIEKCPRCPATSPASGFP